MENPKVNKLKIRSQNKLVISYLTIPRTSIYDLFIVSSKKQQQPHVLRYYSSTNSNTFYTPYVNH